MYMNYIYKTKAQTNNVYVFFKDSSLPAIKLNTGDKVEIVILDDEEHRTFEGWYLEPSLKTKVTFPYTVNENTVFYPKWTYGINKEKKS